MEQSFLKWFFLLLIGSCNSGNPEPNHCPAAMEMTKLNGQNIVCDALLAYVLELCCVSRCPWVRYERRDVDRGVLLKLLATLTNVSKKTRENTTYTVQLTFESIF